MAAADLQAADPAGGWVFFDRGLVDAAVALAHAIGQPIPIGDPTLRAYHRQVFLAPPWPRIYLNDNQRRHTLAAAAAECNRLATHTPTSATPSPSYRAPQPPIGPSSC
jgi:predicted ATPase